ncbi:MAG: hypothetical protein J5733_09535 [Bacteroidaceae bacterium]|nr:hypothetical protein [Bacteroidaceae bacterium]
MYRISPFTPIFFSPSADRHGVKSNCVQVFSGTDRILIEIIATGEESAPPDMIIHDVCRECEHTYSWRSWEMNETTTLYFIELQGMDEGVYYASIGNNESTTFSITSNEEVLHDTVLMQYSNIDNRQRNDAVFWIDGMQRFFDFRVPGGFKDDNWTFVVSNEQFTTNDNDKIDLYGQESTVKALTIGNSEGCPVWFADLINRLLCCNYVYIEKVRYSRNESDVPEMNIEIEGQRSYIFTQGLQKVFNLDPVIEERNLLIMRRVPPTLEGKEYRENTIDNEEFNLIV